MSQEQNIYVREFSIDTYRWKASCNATNMSKDGVKCPINSMISVPGIVFSVRSVTTSGISTAIKADMDTKKSHPLTYHELNRHLYNVLNHVCTMCKYNQKAR